MTDKIRIGLAGTGVGSMHARAFLELPEQFEVVAVSDLNLEKAQMVAEYVGAPRAVTSLEALLAMDEVEVIDLCTPTGLHYQQTLDCLAAGKHVILEKPAAGSLAEVDGLIEASQQSGLQIMPIYNYRFWNGGRKLKFLRERGITGKAYITTIETSWRRRADYYAGWHGSWAGEFGGPLLTLAVHAHDFLLWVLGPARSVFARAKTMVNPIETEDTASVSLEMADGSLVSITVTTGSAEQISRHRFCFERLTAESNLAPYQNTDDPWKFTGDTPEIDGEIQAALQEFVPGKEDFAGQFDEFFRAFRGGEPLPVTLHDARRSIELVTAMYASAGSGRAEALPIGADHPLYRGWAHYAAGYLGANSKK